MQSDLPWMMALCRNFDSPLTDTWVAQDSVARCSSSSVWASVSVVSDSSWIAVVQDCAVLESNWVSEEPYWTAFAEE